MNTEIRTVVYDKNLEIEAYYFKGIKQNFPNHFHEYYVIGYIESGNRYLFCNNKEFFIKPGDLILLNPNDNHTCKQIDNKTLDYRCINIQNEIMEKIIFELTGKKYLPTFKNIVVFQSDLVSSLKELHSIIMDEEKDFKKEELLLLLIEQLLEEHEEIFNDSETKISLEIKNICDYLEINYKSTVSLDDLCKLTGLSKYYLIRSFTKQKGISPYCYLENIRIGNAKKLLEQGVSPLQVALETGFSDQSHFTNFFKKFIGLTPKQYMNIFNNNFSLGDSYDKK